MRTGRMNHAVILISMIAVLQVPLGVFAEQISESMKYSPSDLKWFAVDGYDVVRLPNCEFTDRIGEPQVPVQLIHISIPPGATIENVEVTLTESEELVGSYSIYPAQPPQILSKIDEEDIPFVEPKTDVYNSPDEYPGRLVEFVGTGSMGGYGLASILVYPVQYLSADKTIRLYTRIDFTVNYRPGEEPRLVVKRRSETGEKFYKNLLEHMVTNPEDIARNLPKSKFSSGGFEYLIVTSDAYSSAFQQLADWKTKKGIPAVVRTVSWIEDNYSGGDVPEKIRNYLKHTYTDSGLVWVLLGGDTDVVPERIAYAMTSAAGQSNEDELRADLYYSDLDGDWNANGNGVFGEVADSVDLYPEIFVGRAPVNTLSEAETFVDKVIAYEKNLPGDYQLNTLFFAEILWLKPYTDGGVGKNQIGSDHFPDRFTITKLYESLGNENPSSVISAINSGQNLLNHDGHGWINYMGVGEGGLYPSDMDALVNGSRQGILYSIGCWVGAFHYDAISEHFVNNPSGGGVAFIGNSSYGWGSPGNPGYGYSDRFDATFYEKLFEDDQHCIGVTLAADKIHYIPKSRQENVYRWHQYQLNLLGDPEMPIWTDTPETLEVFHPDTVVAGQSWFSVTVREDSDPVQGALVCLFKENELYERGYTGQNGRIEFDVSAAEPGEMQVTVTHHNFIPYEGSVTVKSTGAWVQYLSHTVIDTTEGNGNGDAEPNPGEIIDIPIEIENFGDQTVSDLTATLRTSNPLVEILDSTAVYSGELLPGSTATRVFRFSISEDAANGLTIYFTLVFAGHDEWNSQIGVVVVTPILTCLNYMVDDTLWGNGNGIAEPDEELLLIIPVQNSGLGPAYGTTAELTTVDPYIDVLASHADCGDIRPDSFADAGFTLRIQSDCPSPYFANLEVLCTTGVYTYSDTVLLTIGLTGFSDDMEGGEGDWTHSGFPGGSWHLTAHRHHSGDSSWYCGTEGMWTYHNFAHIWLLSPNFVLGPNSHLTFWQWCEFTNYGVDGVYVELLNGSEVNTLDFIGSGGALDSLLFIGNDWLQERYDLSSYPAGDTCQVRFTFASDDEDVAEGIYIDDMRVGPFLSPDICVNPSEIEISAYTGEQAVDTFEVHNSAGGYLSFYLQVTTAAKALWLSVMPTYGLVPPRDSICVAAIVDASGLTEGVYSAEIKVTTNDPHKPAFTIPVNLEVFSYLCGDCNGDRITNFADALYIKNYYYQTPPGSPAPIGQGDVNVDGRINFADALYIKNYYYQTPPGSPPPCEPPLKGSDERATVGFSSPRTESGVVEIPVCAQFGVPSEGVGLEVAYDHRALKPLMPELTSRTEGLDLCCNPDMKKGRLLMGVLALTTNQLIQPGDGAVVMLRFKSVGSEVDLSSLRIEEAIVVDEQAREMRTTVLGYPFGPALPKVFSLSQNYPNPLVSTTQISYALPKNVKVKVEVYNLLGEKVKTLVNREEKAGYKVIHWDGSHENGSIVTPGIYFYRLAANGFTATKKMIVVQ